MNDREIEAGAVRRRALLAGGAATALVAQTSLLAVATEALAQGSSQSDWRFCAKCMGMFWGGLADKGRCAAGGAHLAQGFTFQIHFDPARAGPEYQYDWRFCAKCKGLYWDGSPNKGHCPAGGPHAPNGFNFGLNHAGANHGTAQNDWRFCQKCFELFWDAGPNKGACAGGAGGHVAQGFVFSVPFQANLNDPGKAITDAVALALPELLPELQPYVIGLLGQPNLLGKGYTLHKMNFHFGQSDVTWRAPNFEVALTDNYLYAQVTQPSVFGSYADPAFEIHFDVVLRGATAPMANGKPRVASTTIQVTRILVKPRDVTGGIVTTVVRFFQMTDEGGRRIQRAMDKLKIDLTDRINKYLQAF
jgi:hypothetical protein